MSSHPGRTKHLQTHFLCPKLLLCDCPGIVFPKRNVPFPMQVRFPQISSCEYLCRFSLDVFRSPVAEMRIQLSASSHPSSLLLCLCCSTSTDQNLPIHPQTGACWKSANRSPFRRNGQPIKAHYLTSPSHSLCLRWSSRHLPCSQLYSQMRPGRQSVPHSKLLSSLVSASSVLLPCHVTIQNHSVERPFIILLVSASTR